MLALILYKLLLHSPCIFLLREKLKLGMPPQLLQPDVRFGVAGRGGEFFHFHLMTESIGKAGSQNRDFDEPEGEIMSRASLGVGLDTM